MTVPVDSIPQSIPVMTLRGVVLLPSAMMPLRIFEPRYRQMLEDVLSGDRMFAIVREKEDVSPEEAELELPYEIATVGLVRISKKHDDGTSFVLLQGLHRVRIKSIAQEDPYRIIDIDPVMTVANDSIPQIRETLLCGLRKNQELNGMVTAEIIEMLNDIDDNATFFDLVAHHLCRETDIKQSLLEQVSLEKRATYLTEHVESENGKLAFLKQTLGDSFEDEIDSN